MATAWLIEEAPRLSAATLRRYAEHVEQLLGWLAATGRPATVASLSRATLADWRTAMLEQPGRHGRPRSPATVSKAVQAVSVWWTWAEESERWPDVPRARRLRRLAPRPAPVQAPSWAQVDAMLGELARTAATYADRTPEEASPGWIVRLALLARMTGGRRTELLRLSWADYDLERGLLVFRPETTKGGYGGRAVPVSPLLAGWLATWRTETPASSIVGAPRAELLGRGHADRLARRAWARAEVPRGLWHARPLHAMRRCLRTHLVTVGTQADVIDAILGHAGQGSGGRHYTARAALLVPARVALATVPAPPPLVTPGDQVEV